MTRIENVRKISVAQKGTITTISNQNPGGIALDIKANLLVIEIDKPKEGKGSIKVYPFCSFDYFEYEIFCKEVKQ